MIVPVVVEGQSLRWYGRIPEIADNSIEFVQLEFRFPEDWDGMVIVAQFTQTKTYNCPLVNNRCFLPMELAAGPCEVSVFGYLNEEVTRGTTIPLKLNISRSGFVSSAETPIPPTPDLYAQLIEYFSSKVMTDLDTTLTQEGKAADAKAVGDAISKLSGGNVDLTGYATEQFVRDGFQPKGNYLTEVPDGYAKTSEIPKKPEDIGAQPAGNYLTEVPSDYATKEFVTNKIAEAELGGEEVDLSGYAQKSELPTKVSQLQNDAGYLTAVPDEYAKTADIPTKPSDIGAQPEGDYALRSEIPSVPVKSVNGKTGAVSLTAADVKARPDSWMPTASDVGALPSSTVIPTVPTKVSAFTNDAGYLTEHQDLSEYAKKTEIPSVPVKSVNGKTGAVQLSASDVKARPDSWMPSAQEVGALPNTYTPPNQTAEQVGADPAGTAASAVSQHNTDAAAHNDLRIALKGLSDRINAALDSDDATLDQMSEVVAYIKSNKTLIDAITTSKVSVADIVNDLVTKVSNKPLSAAQGVVLKGLIDSVSNSLANYQPKGDYALRSELPTVPTNVSAFTNDAGYLTEHQDISGKLDADKLSEAVNYALEQAKTSGEFDGRDGHTPVKGTDYFTDADKAEMVSAVIAQLPVYAGEVV